MLGVWRLAWGRRYVPARPGVSRPLGRFGMGTPELNSRAQRNLRRGHRLQAPVLGSRITNAPRGLACIGLCCDRIVQLILCRSSRRARTCHLETGIARHPPSRWHIVFQNSSDLLNRAADFPDLALRGDHISRGLCRFIAPSRLSRMRCRDGIMSRNWHVLVFNSGDYGKDSIMDLLCSGHLVALQARVRPSTGSVLNRQMLCSE